MYLSYNQEEYYRFDKQLNYNANLNYYRIYFVLSIKFYWGEYLKHNLVEMKQSVVDVMKVINVRKSWLMPSAAG